MKKKNILLLTQSDIWAYKKSPNYAYKLKVRLSQLKIDITKVDEIIVADATQDDVVIAKKLLDYLLD